MLEPVTLHDLINLTQAPILAWIGYLLFKLSQQFTALAARIDTIIEIAINGSTETEDSS